MTDFDLGNQEFGTDVDIFAEEKPKTNILNSIKPYIKPAIKIIILLVILFVAYWFFFMRYVDVTFQVINLDKGKETIPTTISLEKGGKVKQYNTDEKVRLLPGDYTISIEDFSIGRFYLPNNTLTITKEDDGATITIKLYPEWVKDIPKSEFKIAKQPANIYVGQTVELILNIQNKGNPVNITLKGTNDLNSINEPVSLQTGMNTVSVKFKNNKKVGDKINGTIYIDKARDILKTGSFSSVVKKAPKVKLNVQSSFETHVGTEFTISFEIDNTSKEQIQNIYFDISSASMDPDIIKGWLKNQPKDINVAPNAKKSVDVTFDIPLREVKEKGETITMDVAFKNSYLNLTKSITLKLLPPELIFPDKMDFGTLTAGTNITKTITIENKTKYEVPLKGQAMIDASSTNNMNASQIVYLELPEKIPLEKLELPLTLAIPPKFNSDKIEGTIKISTDFGTYTIPFFVNIIGINIKLDLLQLQSSYSFTFNNVGNSQLDPKETIIKNSGNTDINILNIDISPSNCKTFIDKSDVVFPLKLEKGKQYKFYLTLKQINKSMLTQAQICSVDITYEDPRDGSIQTMQNQFTINAAS